MKRFLLLAALLIGGAATLAGCYEAADAGMLNTNDKYQCFCGNVQWVPEGSPAPACHGKPMKYVMRQP